MAEVKVKVLSAEQQDPPVKYQSRVWEDLVDEVEGQPMDEWWRYELAVDDIDMIHKAQASLYSAYDGRKWDFKVQTKRFVDGDDIYLFVRKYAE